MREEGALYSVATKLKASTSFVFSIQLNSIQFNSTFVFVSISVINYRWFNSLSQAHIIHNSFNRSFISGQTTIHSKIKRQKSKSNACLQQSKPQSSWQLNEREINKDKQR